MTRKKQFHTISREEVQILLARRLIRSCPALTPEQSRHVAGFLLDSKMVTPSTMFYDQPDPPLDQELQK